MITQIDRSDIPGRACVYNNMASREVEDFVATGWDACEVKAGKYKNIHSAVAAYRSAIKKLRVGVTAFERSERLFLVKDRAGE